MNTNTVMESMYNKEGFDKVLGGVVKNELKRLKKYGFQPDHVSHAARMLQDYKVMDIVVSGNFTVVTIGNHVGSNYTGISKRHPRDKYNALRGVMLATSRAIQSALDTMPLTVVNSNP